MSSREAVRTNFKEFVEKIREKEILLPDFQRGFVWNEEERQKKLVASVLAQMPIGNILLFSAKADEFCCKIIGRDENVMDKQDSQVQLLLDGQQRITVLTNVFSNLIFEGLTNYRKLAGDSLKKRFFVKIPKFGQSDTPDIFSFLNLNFPKEIENDSPNVISTELYDVLEVKGFLRTSIEKYHPDVYNKNPLELRDFCVYNSKHYLIPLFLIIKSTDSTSSQSLFEKIISNIGENYIEQVELFFEEGRFTKDELIKCFEITDENVENIHKQLEAKADDWSMKMKNYLYSCVQNMHLARIEVPESDRSRAIDIYENMNMGGVSLSTFDLVMARAAKVEKRRFYDILQDYIREEKEYDIQLVPKRIRNRFKELMEEDYIATLAAGGYKKNKYSDTYLDAFLNVLSLICFSEVDNPDTISVDLTKRKKILSIPPEAIRDNSELTCQALDRALFFLQVRCGIRTIKDIQYKLILTVIAFILKDEKNCTERIFDLLEAWYWAALFSGEFASNQNQRAIENLVRLLKVINGIMDISWIESMRNKALEQDNYSDEKLLLLEKAEYDKYPSASIKNIICQYYLALTYPDFYDKKILMSSLLKDSSKFEIHHIIPLATSDEKVKLNMLSSKLRSNKAHPLNSPLNLIYITDSTNKSIGAQSFCEYKKNIADTTCNQLGIDCFILPNKSDNHAFLVSRYNWLHASIQNHIDENLNEWR